MRRVESREGKACVSESDGAFRSTRRRSTAWIRAASCCPCCPIHMLGTADAGDFMTHVFCSHMKRDRYALPCDAVAAALCHLRTIMSVHHAPWRPPCSSRQPPTMHTQLHTDVQENPPPSSDIKSHALRPGRAPKEQECTEPMRVQHANATLHPLRPTNREAATSPADVHKVSNPLPPEFIQPRTRTKHSRYPRTKRGPPSPCSHVTRLKRSRAVPCPAVPRPQHRLFTKHAATLCR